jgi:hypothetical protein
VKAYLPSVTHKKIYTHFGGFLIDLQLTKKIDPIPLKEQVNEYRKILASERVGRVVVLLHSIDGPNLMNAESQ